MQQVSPFGLQFADPSAPSGKDPLQAPQEVLAAAAPYIVPTAVAVVLYRSTPALEVFLPVMRHSAITGRWLPFNDMKPGDTYEQTVERLTARYFGFVASIDPARYKFVGVCSLGLRQGARTGGRPIHLTVVTVAYAISDEEAERLQLNVSAVGLPSPKPVYDDGQWYSPYAICDGPSAGTYDPALAGLMERFILAIDRP